MNGENSKIEKIKKSSKTVMAVSKGVMIFCIIMDIMLVVLGAFMIAFKNFINEMLQEAIDKGMLAISEIPFNNFGSVDILLAGDYAFNIFISLLGMLVSMILLTVILYFVGKIFKAFRESYSPFMPSILKQLKVVFILIIVISLKSSLLIGAVIGLALWCLYQIFEYGCELQKQSDETL